MQIVAGYALSLRCEQPTPLIGMLQVHSSHEPRLLAPASLRTDPVLPLHQFRDAFGNVGTRLLAPDGVLTVSAQFSLRSEPPAGASDGLSDVPVEALPDDVITFLWPSRYCESDRLAPIAWSQFGGLERGYARVSAILGFVRERIVNGYEYASQTRTAWDTYHERVGVGRDRVHLALSLCRALNLPARYATGFVVTPAASGSAPEDFAVWLEVYLAGGWVPVDLEESSEAASRVVMAYGRDAADVAIYTTFGRSELLAFRVFCHVQP